MLRPPGAGPLLGVSGERPYVACGGGCTAELSLSVFTAQAALSRLDGVLPWAPLLLAAVLADPGCAFAGLPLDIVFAVVSRALGHLRALPATAVPPWEWKPAD